MTLPLQSKEITALHRMIGGGVGFTLLYKISRDGCNASTFHTKCDCQGPTITVLYNTNDTVYGGYTSQSWLGAGTEYSSYDEKAFLFKVRYNGSSVQKKYPIKADNYANAIRCGSTLGPVFGRKESAIPFFVGNVSLSNGIFLFQKGHLDNSYTLNNEDITNGSVNITDLEVYKVDVGDLRTNLNQWRIASRIEHTDSLFSKIWDIITLGLFTYKNKQLDALRKEVQNYSPVKETGVEYANLLLIGHVGSGKSSFVNTVNSIFKGTISHKAIAGSAEKSLTNRYRKCQVRNGRFGKTLNFRLCDTKGIEKDDGIDPHEFCFILDGNMPNGYLFNSSTQLNPDSPGFLAKPSTQDRIHALVIIVDSTNVEIFEHTILENIKIFQDKANQRGIPQIVLLTKIDKVSESLKKNVSKTFLVPAIGALVDKAADLFGVPRSSVIPIKNYENEMELREDINILALLALQQILNFADDYLVNFLESR